MIQKPNISIIVPVYNTASFLIECLDSILNNTFLNFEVICVNDCSTDNSLEILEKYLLKDSRIKIINHQNNLGLPSTLNTGISHCNGECIMFVDSDDFINTNTIEKSYNKIIEDNSDVVIFNYINYPETSKEVWFDFRKVSKEVKTTPKEKADILEYCYNWSKLIKTSLIKNNNIKFINNLLYEDNFFHFALLVYSKRVSVIDQPLYNYRIREGSITNNKGLNVLDAVKITQHIKDFLIENNAFEDYKIPYLTHKFKLVFSRFRSISSGLKPIMMKEIKKYFTKKELDFVAPYLPRKMVRLYKDIFTYPVWFVYLKVILMRKAYFKNVE